MLRFGFGLARHYQPRVAKVSLTRRLGTSKAETVGNFNRKIQNLINSQNYENASKTFEEMKGQAVKLDAETHLQMIHVYSKLNASSNALELVNSYAKQFEPKFEFYHKIFDQFIKDGKVELALQVFAHVKNLPEVNEMVYFKLLLGCEEANLPDDALALLREMKEKKLTRDVGFFNIAIYTLGKAGRLSDMDKIFQELKQEGVTPNIQTFSSLISSVIEHELPQLATVYFKEMKAQYLQSFEEAYAKEAQQKGFDNQLNNLVKLYHELATIKSPVPNGAYKTLLDSLPVAHNEGL